MSDLENGDRLETYASVWDAITDTPAEAANLKLRSELMDRITAVVALHGWTQNEAAMRCGATQPRMNHLLRERMSRLSLGASVNIAAALGMGVSRFGLEAACCCWRELRRRAQGAIEGATNRSKWLVISTYSFSRERTRTSSSRNQRR